MLSPMSGTGTNQTVNVGRIILATTFLRDLREIRAAFEESGVSVAEWARVNSFSTGLVYQVLEGRRQCVRGQSYRIAIALGLRHGIALDVSGLSDRLAKIPLQSTPAAETAM